MKADYADSSAGTQAGWGDSEKLLERTEFIVDEDSHRLEGPGGRMKCAEAGDLLLLTPASRGQALGV